jgi:hypothetical protein
MQAMVAGEDDAARPDDLAQRRMRSKIPQLEQAA